MTNVDVMPDMVDDLKRQEDYIEKQKSKKNSGMGLVFADAFLRGMRDLGYKSPATAIDELVDNSIQANATIVDIVFAHNGKSKSKPDQIAIVDNGHGMLPDMIYFAVKWGGTHREGDRSGFGRYGYGLPSASVSIAKRYTVYSKVSGGDWHSVTVDIDELAKMAERGGSVDIPEAIKKEPPKFVMDRKKPLDLKKLKSGSVVVLEDMDRMSKLSGWKQSNAISAKLIKHLGVIYRHIIPKARVFVNDIETQIVDPLFLMESGRFYDETSVMAIPIETASFETETKKGQKGLVKIRASLLPPNFQLTNPHDNLKKGKKNHRLKIMEEYHGLIICRAGRQIDCISPRKTWATYGIYDRNIKIELDFAPELDEFFGITTSKQQIVIEEDMWQKLESAHVPDLIKDMRKKREELRSKHEVNVKSREEKEERRISEEAMQESEKFVPQPTSPSPEKVKKAKMKLQQEAEKESDRKDKPLEEVLEEIKVQTECRPYKVEFQAIPEGPFYRSERIGIQKKLIINTQHPFYTHLYDSPDSGPGIQSALEVLLFVLADAEIAAEGEMETFYQNARKNWSDRLSNALKSLDKNGDIFAKKSALQEEGEMATAV